MKTTDAGPTDAELVALVDDRLRAYVRHGVASGRLRDAVDYALFGGGKRVRPLLCMRACEAVGGNPADAVSAAGAVELVHCFSLVHDDLPAMDDDDLRRGRPTLHKHTDEAMAILAGDAMTAMAFQLLTMPGKGEARTPAHAADLVGVLAVSTLAMINGQVYDTMGGVDDVDDDLQQLRAIHHHKTAMLLLAAASMGAICGRANHEQSVALEVFAQSLGLMFQAVDDLLDVTQPTERVGKQTGKDAAAGKLTYPGLLGIDGTRAEIAKLLDQSLEALEPLGPRADPLREMARRLAERTK